VNYFLVKVYLTQCFVPEKRDEVLAARRFSPKGNFK
jgi:hypothetical protein